ncbi:conserved Plasmodium protein, unknown function [Plasmodium ovale]|uniref:Uncharacterized protein n=2 Tax=Plasmodium ovale TaxID=36330 RepID=A0A1C3KT27_PLAOA|nr:conserved Plasmodium protein, unknown function [Plasmodium ovale]
MEKMVLRDDNSKGFCIFLDLFKTRVNLLQIKKRNEIVMQKKNIYVFLLKGEVEKAHANICWMLRNEKVCTVCKKLIDLCNQSSFISFLSYRSSNNNNELKRCIRNILYCSNKLHISNGENLRLNFIKQFGKNFIEDIETDFQLLDMDICTLVNKYTFNYNEIRQVENTYLYEINVPIKDQKERCLCRFCTYTTQKDYTIYDFKKNDIHNIVKIYSNYSECIYDKEKKNILKKIEKQLILKLDKALLQK